MGLRLYVGPPVGEANGTVLVRATFAALCHEAEVMRIRKPVATNDLARLNTVSCSWYVLLKLKSTKDLAKM